MENIMKLVNKYTYEWNTGLETFDMKKGCKVVFYWYLLWGPVAIIATQFAQFDAIIHRKFSVPTYLPVIDEYSSPYFEILTIIYYIGTVQMGMSFTTLDNITLPPMVLSAQQFQMLGGKLKSIHFTALINIGIVTKENVKLYRDKFFTNYYKAELEKLYDSKSTIEYLFQCVLTEEQKVMYEKELQKLMLECVEYHQILTDCCNEFDQILSPIWLIKSLYAALNISIGPFYAYTYKDKNPVIAQIMFEYAALQTFEYGIFCNYGQHLLEASDKFRQAAYDSAWYTTNSKFCKKLLLMMILRSNKSVSINAGKFFSLSMELYSNILQKSFSFFTFMQNMAGE
ncbi:odorant receptor 83a-like [Chrysoperla carnea]|uniref:odorant receptor 83a-like n=1 Tax=Chrysoperla carnea TaxID=189513 RepID=UPI001D07D6BA|nr:odorant receptor 83a-like [Chrysoperla carnea]